MLAGASHVGKGSLCVHETPGRVDGQPGPEGEAAAGRIDIVSTQPPLLTALSS